MQAISSAVSHASKLSEKAFGFPFFPLQMHSQETLKSQPSLVNSKQKPAPDL